MSADDSKRVRDLNRYDRLRELLKARSPLPPGYTTPQALVRYENFIPLAVRRAALRANHLVRGNASAQRKHRATGGRKGPHIDDTELARHVYRRVREYLLSQIEAERELADALASAECIDKKSARVRIRKALGKLQ